MLGARLLGLDIMSIDFEYAECWVESAEWEYLLLSPQDQSAQHYWMN
jgi:hypothetical protein